MTTLTTLSDEEVADPDLVRFRYLCRRREFWWLRRILARLERAEAIAGKPDDVDPAPVDTGDDA